MPRNACSIKGTAARQSFFCYRLWHKAVVHIPHKIQQRQATVRGRAADGLGKCLRCLRCKLSVRNVPRNACFRRIRAAARLSLFSTAQVLFRPTPRTADCLAVVSNPAATKVARISASFEACFAFVRRLLLRCRIAHTAHKFASRLVLGSVVSGLRYSSLGAPPEPRRFDCVSLKNVTNALRQLGICQHAFGRFRI